MDAYLQRIIGDIKQVEPGSGRVRMLVEQIPTRSGGWYTVRIMPYRTVENVIDGVVVTFINITESKLLEAQLRSMQKGPERA